MGHSSAVGFLAFALCLVACVFASAAENSEGDGTSVTLEQAKKAVEDAKPSTKKACDNAKNYAEKAKGLLLKVEAFKKETEKAKSNAQDKARDNKDAAGIVENIKTIANEVSRLHQDAKTKLDKTIANLGKWLSAAQTLDREYYKEIVANEDSENNYSRAKNLALTIKSNAETLDTNISDELKIINGVESTAGTMEQNAKEAQLKSFHFSVIVAVAKIETMLGEAESIFTTTQNQRDAVNGLDQAMTKHCTAELIDSSAIIKEQCQRSKDELTKATNALGEAQQAEADVKQQKQLANVALINVQKSDTDLIKARQEADTANTCVTTADQNIVQLKSALETARNAVINANDSKEKIDTALSTATSEKRPEQSGINPEVKTLQGSVGAAVTEIQTMMDNADINLQKTKKHKEDVNDIVEEVKKLCTTDLTDSNEIMKEQCKSANDELTNATGAVQNATKAIADMTQQKDIADAALTKVAAANEVNEAQQQVNTATDCVAKVKEIVSQLQSALQTAANSVTNAKVLKQKLKTALSTTTSAPTPKEVKETEKSDLSVLEGTGPDPKEATIQPTTTGTEQTTSKDSPDQIDNSADKLKEKLIKGAKNVTTTALIGGKVPALAANNDSAMTVSVPLLVALIASAVLQ